MQRKYRANSLGVLVVCCVSIFVSMDVYALDCGEWKTIESGFAGRGRAERWRAFRESSESYRVKSGIAVGAKPDGNIIVAEIANRIAPFNKQKIVLRSSMYPFGQINRAYDSIDLADILLGSADSADLKTRVFLYNKLCALKTALDSVEKTQRSKKTEKIQAVLAIKQDLISYMESIEVYTDQALTGHINALSHDVLQVPQLGIKIKNLRSSIMPFLRRYIINLQEYFLGIHSIIGDSITLDGLGNIEVPIGIVAGERIKNVLTICGDEKTYDAVNTALKQAARFRDNAHRLVHSEDMLLYYITHSLPDYRPTLICTYLNMCRDCEQVVSMFANIRNGGDGLIVVSEEEIPGEEDIRRNTAESLVKKIKIPHHR